MRSILSLACGLALSVASAQTPPSLSALVVQLQDVAQSGTAKAEILQHSRTITAKHQLADQLIPVLGTSASAGVYTNELSLIRTLHLYDTIPKLVELLTTQELFGPITFGGLESLHDDPVGLTLSRLGERAVEALVPVLDNPNREVRMRTITILFAMPEPSAHEALIQALHQESDPRVQQFIRSRLRS